VSVCYSVRFIVAFGSTINIVFFDSVVNFVFRILISILVKLLLHVLKACRH